MINREQVYSYFERYHGPVEQSSNGWYTCKCPICGRDKFALNFTHLIGKCWRGCINGFVFDAIRIYHGITYFEARELVESMDYGALNIPSPVNRVFRESNISLPKGYHTILEGNTNLAYRAREYLQGRNFDLEYLDRIGVGYCNKEGESYKENYLGYIIVPFKKNGILRYFIGRDFIGNRERYKNPPKENGSAGKADFLFNEEALFLNNKVYLTEGWACAATMKNGVSIQGSIPSTIQRNIVVKSPVDEVIIIPDAGYYKNGLEAASYLMKYKKVKVVNIDRFQKEGIGKDINEIGKENVINTEEKTQWMDDNFLFRQLRIFS